MIEIIVICVLALMSFVYLKLKDNKRNTSSSSTEIKLTADQLKKEELKKEALVRAYELLDRFKNSKIDSLGDFGDFLNQIDSDASNWKVVHRKSGHFPINDDDT